MERHRTRVAIHRNGPTDTRKTYTYDVVRDVPDTVDGLVGEMQTLGERYVAVVGEHDGIAHIIPFHSIASIDVYAVPLDADPPP